MLGLAILLGMALIGFVVCAIAAKNAQQRFATYTAFILFIIIDVAFFLLVYVLGLNVLSYFLMVCVLAIPIFGYLIVFKNNAIEDAEEQPAQSASLFSSQNSWKAPAVQGDSHASWNVDFSEKNAQSAGEQTSDAVDADETAQLVRKLQEDTMRRRRAAALLKANQANSPSSQKGNEYGVFDVSEFDDDLDSLIDEAPEIDMKSAKTLSEKASHAKTNRPKHGSHAKQTDALLESDDFEEDIEKAVEIVEEESQKAVSGDDLSQNVEFFEDLEEPVMTKLDSDGSVHFDYEEPLEPYDFVTLGTAAAIVSDAIEDGTGEVVEGGQAIDDESSDIESANADAESANEPSSDQSSEQAGLVSPESDSEQQPEIDSQPAKRDTQNMYEMYINKAQTLMDHGTYEIAALIFSKASEVAPKTALTRKAKFSQMQCLVKAGNIRQAKALATDLRSYKVLTAQENVMLKVVESL